jgi:hypothetical protein
MPFKPKTSPVIRATLTAMDAVNALRDARMNAGRSSTRCSSGHPSSPRPACVSCGAMRDERGDSFDGMVRR